MPLHSWVTVEREIVVTTNPSGMRHVSDWIRNHIECNCGLLPPITIEEIRAHVRDRVDPGLELLCKERLEMGFIRYESKLGRCPDYLSRMKKMVLKYEGTRNREYLVDLLNFIQLEWTTPSLADTYFEVDDNAHHSDSAVFGSQ